MRNKILIVGKNSRLYQVIHKLWDTSEYVIVPISGKMIDTIDENVLNQTFRAAIILSYSKNLSENNALINRLSLIDSEIFIYISSISVNCYEAGYNYKYPYTKKMCEIMAKLKLKNLTIMRIGLVPEVYKIPYGHSYVSTVPSIINFFVSVVRDDIQSTKAYVSSFINADASAIETVIYKIYKKVYNILGNNAIYLRPVDLVLRIMGYKWYGYHMAVNIDA